MKAFYFILVASLTLLHPMAEATPESLTKQQLECACQSDQKDPLETPQAFNFGKFKDQCIDTCRFRPARILSRHHVGLPSESVRIGNILHFGKFYQAEVRWEDIASVEAGFEQFLPAIHHVFLRFNLKDSASALQLSPQTGPKGEMIQVRSLVISSEGVPPKSHRYNIVESYFGNYLLAHRLVTGDEMLRWTGELKHPLKMFSLDVTPELAGRILARSIDSSNQLQFQNVYELFTNNCSTSTLGFIDPDLKDLPRTTDTWSKFEEALPITGPIGTLRALMRRHLVNRQTL